MTDQTKGPSRGGRPGLGPPWPAILASCGLLTLGAWFYLCIVMPAGSGDAEPVAQLWGVRGDAMGPFAALFNAGALLAALWAVHLQRQELHETRAEMKAQRQEFERTAEAQEALAASQKRLADAQDEANRQTFQLRIVEHGKSIATLDAALATLKAAEVLAVTTNPRARRDVELAFAERRQSIGNRIAMELFAEQQLAAGRELE